MKTKIFVCSNSGIDYIPHSVNIKSIPVILHFSEEEQYQDYLDVSIEAFYSRMRFDENANIKPVFQTYVKICEYIDEARNDGYQQVLFILAAKEFSDLYIPIQIAISENKDIPCYIYNSNTISYPLAYMTNEADNMLIGGASILEVIERLDYLKDNHRLLFFVPDCYDENLNSFKKKYQNGQLYILENGQLILIKNKSKSFKNLIDMILAEAYNENTVVFSLYTDKTSVYLSLFEKSISEAVGENKKIKSYPITPGVGINIGSYVIGMGYIVK